MTETSTADDTPVTKKKPLISLPFIVGALILLVGGYFAGPYIMQMVMLQQEKAKANRAPTKHEVPTERPSLPAGS
ncbi:MAG: hypothetical protein KDB03_10750 [Planctomycetales bacterium]|nr:hypothetical protein [Planctomycetales bacterium]